MQKNRYCINKKILFLIISFGFILFFLIFILSNKINISSQAKTKKVITCYRLYRRIFFRESYLKLFDPDDLFDPLYNEITTVGFFNICPSDSYKYVHPPLSYNCCINEEYFNNQGTIRCNSYTEGTDYKCKLDCSNSGDDYTELVPNLSSCEQIDATVSYPKFPARAYGMCCSRNASSNTSPTASPTYSATPTGSNNYPTSTYQPANTPQTTGRPTVTLIPASTSTPQPTSTTSTTGCQDGATYTRSDGSVYTIKIFGNRICVQIGSGGAIYGTSATLTNACNTAFPHMFYKDTGFTNPVDCNDNYCGNKLRVKPGNLLCNY